MTDHTGASGLPNEREAQMDEERGACPFLLTTRPGRVARRPTTRLGLVSAGSVFGWVCVRLGLCSGGSGFGWV